MPDLFTPQPEVAQLRRLYDTDRRVTYRSLGTDLKISPARVHALLNPARADEELIARIRTYLKTHRIVVRGGQR